MYTVNNPKKGSPFWGVESYSIAHPQITLCSQLPATGPYAQSDEFIPYPHTAPLWPTEKGGSCSNVPSLCLGNTQFKSNHKCSCEWPSFVSLSKIKIKVLLVIKNY